MTDVMTPEQRSKNMAAIHSKNTKPEVFLRKELFHDGYRYSISSKTVPGHPDIYLKKYNTAIFVNGCFWHRHENCKLASIPKSNQDYWEKKFKANVERDLRLKNQLKERGVKQVVIWECTVRKMKKNSDYLEEVVSKIEEFLNNEVQYIEM